MRLIFILLFSIVLGGCSWLGTLSSVLPTNSNTDGYGNNNKVLVGDNSTNVGNKSIDTDDVEGDVLGRDKYNAETITVHHTDFWELLGAAIFGAFTALFTRFVFIMMNRRRRRQMFRCMKDGVKRGRSMVDKEPIKD